MASLDVSDALGDTFRTVFRNLGTYLRTQGPLLLLVGLIGLAANLFVTTSFLIVHQDMMDRNDLGAILEWLPTIGGFVLAVFVASWLLNVLTLGVGIVATDRLLQGQDTTFGDAFSAVKPRFGSLLLTSLLITLATLGVILAGFALFFLVLPIFLGIAAAIYLAVRWAPALPVSVLEDHQSSENLARARDMTVGARLSIFGAFLLLILAFIAASIVVGIPIGIVAWTTMGGSLDPTRASPASLTIDVVSWALNLVVQALSTFLMTALLVVVYHRLRQPAPEMDGYGEPIGGGGGNEGAGADYGSPPPGY